MKGSLWLGDPALPREPLLLMPSRVLVVGPWQTVGPTQGPLHHWDLPTPLQHEGPQGGLRLQWGGVTPPGCKYWTTTCK